MLPILRNLRRVAALATVLFLTSAAALPAQGRAAPILLEAEAFKDHGGWVLDQRCMY